MLREPLRGERAVVTVHAELTVPRALTEGTAPGIQLGLGAETLGSDGAALEHQHRGLAGGRTELCERADGIGVEGEV